MSGTAIARQDGRGGCGLWLGIGLLTLLVGGVYGHQAVGGDEYGLPAGLPPTAPCWPDPCQGTACDPCDRADSTCPDKCDFFLVPPRLCWYATADGAYIRRDTKGNFLAASLGSAPGGVVLSTKELEGEFEPAGRFMIGHTLDECWQIEGTYLRVCEMDRMQAVRNTSPNAIGGTGDLFSPFGGFGAAPVIGVDYNDFAQIQYRTSLTGADLFLRRKLPIPPERVAGSILFGVRYLELPDDFNYQTESTAPAPLGTINSIHVAARNRMIGPEVGATFEFYVENRWWLNLDMKAALLSDSAEQSTEFTSSGVTYLTDRSEKHVAFAGDLALTLIYRWSPHCSTRLGYQATWLQDVALAPGNFNTNLDLLRDGPGQLRHDGRAVYHGPVAGLTLGW